MEMMKQLLLVFMLLFFTQRSVLAQSDAYIITAHPQKITLLDKYQQHISASDKALLPKFLPWLVVEKDVLLSDQVSRAHHVQYLGHAYYLLAEKENMVWVHNAQSTADTLTVIQNRAVLFRQIQFNIKNSQYKKSYLKNGIRFRTLFKKNNAYYVQILSPERKFGWVRFSGAFAVKKNAINRAEGAYKIPTALKQDIVKLIKRKNDILKRLFKKLNKDYNQQIKSPFWQVEENEAGLVILLNSVKDGRFKRSSTSLAEEIESLLVGTPLRTHVNKSRIEVLPGKSK